MKISQRKLRARIKDLIAANLNDFARELLADLTDKSMFQHLDDAVLPVPPAPVNTVLPPTAFKYFKYDEVSGQLRWARSKSPNISSYLVLRNAGDGAEPTVEVQDTEAGSAELVGTHALDPNKSYRFSIKARNAAGGESDTVYTDRAAAPVPTGSGLSPVAGGGPAVRRANGIVEGTISFSRGVTLQIEYGPTRAMGTIRQPVETSFDYPSHAQDFPYTEDVLFYQMRAADADGNTYLSPIKEERFVSTSTGTVGSTGATAATGSTATAPPPSGTFPATHNPGRLPPIGSAGGSYAMPGLGQSTVMPNGMTITTMAPYVRYSKISAEGAPGRSGGANGSGLLWMSEAQVRDSLTLQPVAGHGFAKQRAAFIDPNVGFGFRSGSTRLERWNVASNKYDVLFDFASQGASGQLNFGLDEGNQSFDDDKFLITNDPGVGISEFYAFSVAGGFIAKKTLEQVYADVESISAYDGGGPVNRLWVKADSAQYDPTGKYIMVLLTKRYGAAETEAYKLYQGYGIVRYDADFTHPVILGARPPGGGNVTTYGPGHGCFILDKQYRPYWVNAHYNGHHITSLDDPRAMFRVPTGVDGYGHYSFAPETLGMYSYSEGGAPGKIELHSFDPDDYIGGVITTEGPEYISYPLLPKRPLPAVRVFGVNQYMTTKAGGGPYNTEPTACLGRQADRVYSNINHPNGKHSAKIYYA